MRIEKQTIYKAAKRMGISVLATLQLFALPSFGSMIDENAYQIPVSRGITFKHITQTFENGVQSIYLTTADLSDPALQLQLLYNKQNGFSNRLELSELNRQAEGAAVTINGDFFSTTNPSYATGIMYENGKLLSSPSYKNGEMASMVLDQSGNILFDYLSSGVVLENTSNGQTYQSLSVNKQSTSFIYPIVLTSEYQSNTPGSKSGQELVELIVQNGTVGEIRIGQPSTAIPAGSFAVVASGTKAVELQQKFAVGDSVRLTSSAEQVYANMTTAIGGGTMILRNGQPTAITHSIKGKSQRTAVGVTYDNKLIFMVTDGRTGAYIGMDENDVASFLRTQNVKDAMMLDGGGSSEMIINGRIINNLVAKERKLLNGLSVVNTAPKGSLSQLQAVLENESIVQGDRVRLIVQGFDSGMNPVALGTISVSGQGVNVTYADGYITANSGGKGNLIISSGGASTSIPIAVSAINPIDPKRKEATAAMDFVIIPNGSSDKSDALGQVLNAKIVEKSATAKTAIMMFNKSQELSSNIKIAKETVSQSGQIINNNGITFLGLSTAKGIGGTAGQWTAIKNALASSNKDIVFLMNGSMELNSSEKKIFRKLLNDASGSKNIFVVSLGKSFDSYAEGNVSYISIMDNAIASGEKDSDFKMLGFRRQNGTLVYSFTNLF